MLQGSVVFKISDTNESFFLDLKSEVPVVSKGEGENPDLVVTVQSSNMSKLITGELKPQQAFMKGKLKIKGNMKVNEVEKLFKDTFGTKVQIKDKSAKTLMDNELTLGKASRQ